MKYSGWLWQLRYRFHPKHQYHIVRTALQPGYHDQDTRMMYAMFALLLDRIDEEGGAAKIAAHADEMEAHPDVWVGYGPSSNDKSQWSVDDWATHFNYMDAVKSHVDARREKLALHHWWTVERQQAWDGYYALIKQRYSDVTFLDILDKKVDMTDRPTSEEVSNLCDQLEAKDDEMLQRLLVIRRELWT